MTVVMPVTLNGTLDGMEIAVAPADGMNVAAAMPV